MAISYWRGPKVPGSVSSLCKTQRLCCTHSQTHSSFICYLVISGIEHRDLHRWAKRSTTVQGCFRQLWLELCPLEFLLRNVLFCFDFDGMDFKKAYLPPLLPFDPKETSHGCPYWDPGGNRFVSTAGKGFTPPLCSHSLPQRHRPHMGTAVTRERRVFRSQHWVGERVLVDQGQFATVHNSLFSVLLKMRSNFHLLSSVYVQCISSVRSPPGTVYIDTQP